MMRTPFFILLLLLIVCQAAGQEDGRSSTNPVLESLIAADKAFALSARTGDVADVADFWAEDGVMLLQGEVILRGRNQILEFVRRSRQDAHFAIDWKVEGGAVSESGEFGYTYGTGQITLSGPDGSPVVHTNPYLVVWRKDNGKWHVIAEK